MKFKLKSFDKTFLRNSIYVFLTDICTFFLRFLLNVAIVRSLSKEEFGQYGYVLSVVALFAFTSLSGMNIATQRAVARGYDSTFKVALRTKAKYALIGLGILSIFGIYEYYVRQSNKLAFLFFIAALFFIPHNVIGIYRAFFVGKEQFDRLFLMILIENLFVVFTTGVVALLTKSVNFVLITIFASTSLIQSFMLIKTLSRVENEEVDDETITYGKHLTLVGIFDNIQDRADRLIINHLMNFSQLAIYILAIDTVDRIRGLSGFITTTIFPKACKLDSSGLYKNVSSYGIYMTIFYFGMACAGALFAHFFIPLLYGSQYREAVPYTQLSFINMFLESMIGLFVKILFPSQKKSGAIVKVIIIGMIVKFPLYFLLVPWLQLFGAVLSNITASVFMLVSSYFIANRYFRKG